MQIVNKSLSTGEFPQAFKNALVTPLLKKQTLDENILNNYRPVSNLAFVSNITEKVVASRLNHHLMVNNLQEPFQSAYRMNHSTETAMLRVQNDIIRALGDNNVVLLILIDLSAAFDMLNHKRLLNTLHAIGMTGKALAWFTSYLQNRSQPLPSAANNLDLNNWSAACLKGRSFDPSCSTYTLLPLASSYAKKRPTTQCTPMTLIST